MCCLFVGAVVVSADESADADTATVSFWNDVRPIFQAHCQGCHQPAKKGGEYDMTSLENLFKGGESEEAAIVPGDPAGSNLIGQITPSDGAAEMPKNAKPLTDADIAKITKWIAAGAKDDTPESARRRFDSDNPPTYSAAPVITAVAISPDGNLVAVSGYHEVLLHETDKLIAGDATNAGRLIGMSERIESVAFSPDGKMLAVAGGSPGRLGELQIWNVADRAMVFSNAVTFDTCYGASWSPDGKLVAFGCPDNTVRAIRVEDGKQVLFNGAHNDWVLDTVFSVKGTNLVTVSRDRSMKLMEVATERFIDNVTSITPGALKGGLHAVDRDPAKDELLIGGSDGVPKIYRMFREQDRKIGDDFNLIRKFPEMPGRVFDVSYSKDGKKIVAGSSYNGNGHVHVFETESGKKLAEMKDVDGAIYTAAFNPDATIVVSGGFSGNLLVHDAATGERKSIVVPVPLDKTQIANK
ncbi:MAG: PD40 domain-containing protein [Planctomycetales bacterium]|nr:PD40 domain-containing protein [Planctomycetales bacterium]